MKKKFSRNQILFTALSIFLLSVNLNAQIESIQVGSTTRNMLVYAPSGIKQNSPLLLSLHGLNQDITYQQNQTKWESVADANGFVIVYPAGINNSWDLNGTGDTDFILAIIDEMYDRYGIDRDRVYLSGFSMGGMMTYHAARRIADKIAAFAPVSGYLMGGPSTGSSRPIPIIHTHGTGDPVVPYSGVQTCLNAWISRNGCPVTAQVTKPYPVDKPSSNGTKYYWGPGKDGVEIVLLSLAGVGHWHSLDGNGVHTSQEIWNFCKKYSLRFGIPEFEFAAVTDNNPKQILVNLNMAIVDSNYFDGFTVKVDSQTVTIDSIVLADTNQLVINLRDSILNNNEILLSYTNGNVFSLIGRELSGFNDTVVDNLLKGASPRLVELTITENGDTLMAKFNMKMHLPSDLSALTLNAEYNGDTIIPVLQNSIIDNDSTLLSFSLDEKVYADYNLLLSYSGNNIVSADSSLLKTFSDFPVINYSKGLPVHFDTAKIAADGTSIFLEFSKPMAFVPEQLDQLTLKMNGENVSLQKFYVSKNTIRFTMSQNVHHGDTVIISYTSGDITAADKGTLEGFSDFTIVNPLGEPTWQKTPGKVQAEKYYLQSGIQTENTSDTGGGLNVGYIDTGDWLEYAIENTASETNYDIAFRVASPNTGSRFDYYLDNTKIEQISVPNTGGWQTWQSVVKELTLEQGKHYLKIVVTNGGFNINYIDIGQYVSGIKETNDEKIKIYPNPVSNEMILKSADFQYNKIEIIDMMGKTVLHRLTDDGPEFRMPVRLSNGLYIVKISNEKQYLLKRIIVDNN